VNKLVKLYVSLESVLTWKNKFFWWVGIPQ